MLSNFNKSSHKKTTLLEVLRNVDNVNKQFSYFELATIMYHFQRKKQ